ncbi:hypothetical protein BUALT_Bualt06G0134200 [Buddleja alternifolia]|uniref:F-box associated beta-propeller type 3 domain-containing protein n=1 Tax=Buddleja alternifolia TaxID=168488 RepID=A0AAV6XMV7_9LAMI|nr:hypothetical protein BUALT_Bualt06G0134200 [Buddleja alternifolia]
MQSVGDTDFFIQPDYEDDKLELHAISPKISNTSSNTQQITSIISSQSLEFILTKGKVIASSNGLLCCRNRNDHKYPLILFNPTTRAYLQIPTPDESITPHMDITIVFDYDQDNESMDYMLMAIVGPSESWGNFQSKIYSPEKGVWRDGGRIYLGARDILSRYSFIQNGVVYMISDHGSYLTKNSPFRWPYIVAYEIKNSSSRFLKLPKGIRKGLEGSKLGIFKWGNYPNMSLNSICLVKSMKNVFTVWVLMISDGNSYYWSRVLKMRVRAMGLAYFGDLKVVEFTVLNGSVLLFANEERIYKYNLREGINGKLEEVCEHNCGEWVQFNSFSSTLCPCGPGAIRDEARNFVPKR